MCHNLKEGAIDFKDWDVPADPEPSEEDRVFLECRVVGPPGWREPSLPTMFRQPVESLIPPAKVIDNEK